MNLLRTKQEKIMNRTALCIQMLMLLKSRDRITSKELAEELQTNPRNIREFRKELETAGYHVSEKRGRYGGYSLDDSSLLPIPELSADEIEDLGQIRNYLSSIDLPLASGSASKILDKILAGANHSKDPSQVRYIKDFDRQLSKRQSEMITKAMEAKNRGLRVGLLYQKKDSDEQERRIVDPYEVYTVDGAWYLNGWDKLREAYRNFRFSDQRMYDLEILDEPFLRDSDYHFENYTGSHGAYKGRMEKYAVSVSKQKKGSFLELYWGAELQKVGETRHWITYTFLDDQPWQVFNGLFFLGDAIRLLEPEHRVREYEEKIAKIAHLYSKTSNQEPDQEQSSQSEIGQQDDSSL